MSVSAEPTPTASAHEAGNQQTSSRSDFFGALAWMGLGLAILIGSITMDRLEAQDVNPYTIPGLMPGLLGIAMLILGGLLAFRSWKTGMAPPPQTFSPSERRAHYKHLGLVLVLSLTFGVVLVGHGLPFWLASAVFVSTAIPCLQGPQRRAAGVRLTWRAIGISTLIGVLAGGIITIVFQKIFLVHLP
jgi:hypothetical protein